MAYDLTPINRALAYLSRLAKDEDFPEDPRTRQIWVKAQQQLIHLQTFIEESVDQWGEPLDERAIQRRIKEDVDSIILDLKGGTLLGFLFKPGTEGRRTMDGIKHLHKVASSFVPITRDELEEWLDTFQLHGKWYLVPGRHGIYYLPLSDLVGIKLSSTIASPGSVVERGEASMQLALVAMETGQVLNKKAMGQKYFARTTNWRANWKVGIDRMKEAFVKSASFYDALARIPDRRLYKTEMLERIQAIPGWQKSQILSDFHKRLTSDGILTEKQEAVIDRVEREPRKPDQEVLVALRGLWTALKTHGDHTGMAFVERTGKQYKETGKIDIMQIGTIKDLFMKMHLPLPASLPSPARSFHG